MQTPLQSMGSKERDRGMKSEPPEGYIPSDPENPVSSADQPGGLEDILADIEDLQDADLLEEKLHNIVSLSKTGKTIGIRNQVMFALGVTALVFTYAALRTNLEYKASLGSFVGLAEDEFSWSKFDYLEEDQSRHVEWLEYYLDNMNSNIIDMVPAPALEYLWNWCATATRPQRMIYPAIFIHFLLWIAAITPKFSFRRITIDLKSFVSHHFVHTALDGRSYTLLTSIFRPSALLHVCLVALTLPDAIFDAWYHLIPDGEPSLLGYTFPSLKLLNKEKFCEVAATHHLAAFLISTGVLTPLFTHIMAAKYDWPRFLVQIRRRIVALREPGFHSNLGYQNLKQAYPINYPTSMAHCGVAGTMVAVIIIRLFSSGAYDLQVPPVQLEALRWTFFAIFLAGAIGTSRRWRYLQDWGFLAGMAYGFMYCHFGPVFWMALRRSLAPISDAIYDRLPFIRELMNDSW